MIFESKRLHFRPLLPEDLTVLSRDIWGNESTMRYCGNTIKSERIAEIIRYDRKQYAVHGNAVFAMIHDETLIGICGGKLDEDNPLHVELIIHISPSHQHRGYGKEALSAYIAWLKESKLATYIYATIHPGNQASLGMVQACGLVHNGFRQYADTGFVDEPYFEMSL